MDRLRQGWARYTRGDYAAAEVLFQAVLDDPTTPPEGIFEARFNLGYCAASTGHLGRARAIYGALRQDAQASGTLQTEHVLLHQLGMVERMADNWTAAWSCFEEERRLIAALGDDDLAVAINAYELGLVALHLGRATESRSHFETSLLCAQRTTDSVAVGCAHRGLGEWHAAHGHAAEAAAEWTLALTAFRTAGDEPAARNVLALLNPT
ncbi:tetratricopeptide (TPR) repeat protein [Deinococcus metalli]|uniref:Tetratricopeptide (TPR) repeat protein n=1 Tax=Deinococcus metalli TaxID=1141878 RepID=A0A7W8KG58_9DEIO|nr:tetratricopeptide repeat protein [Deinococcus metalli]MBB5377310.1 tetratricopeptide (TPR) repeat protein [Deinococcus metalli]GHF47458.1 hypothetical protein GCM10017781_24640 [Deinococcus metalli]